MNIFPRTVEGLPFGFFYQPGDQDFLGLLFLSLGTEIESRIFFWMR